MKNYEDMDERQIQDEQQKEQNKQYLKDEAYKHARDAYKNHLNSDKHQTPSTPSSENNSDLAKSASLNNNAANTSEKNGASGLGTGTPGGAMAGTTAGGMATGASAGASSGAAAGASAGSVVPGLGTAAGAVAGVVGGMAKNTATNMARNEASDAVDAEFGKSKAKVSGSTKTSSTSDSGAVKAMAAVFGFFFGIVVFIAAGVFSIIYTIAKPFIFLYEQAMYGWDACVSFFEDVFTDEPSFEEIAAGISKDFIISIEDSYKNVCYREIYQIASEQKYNWELTEKSYLENEFPYVLEGENATVNYAELLCLVSMSDLMPDTYKEFDYNVINELLENDEYQRCLYDLKVVPTEGFLFAKETLNEGDIGSVDENGVVTIIRANGSKEIYEGEDAKAYYEVVTYGKVTVSHYSLKKMFDYFGIDPYEMSVESPNLTYYQYLNHVESTTRKYCPEAEWGSVDRTELLDYEVLTGELTMDVQNVYEQDFLKLSIFTDTEVCMEMTEYKQGNPLWGSLPYGKSGKKNTISELGCCVVSMCMVCDYFSADEVTPYDLWYYMNNNEHYIKNYSKGDLYRDAIAKAYGFKQTETQGSFNAEKVANELKLGRPVIAHIKGGSRGTGKFGHYVVLNGYKFNDAEAIFYVKEPASRLESTIDVTEAVEIFDTWQSYGMENTGVNSYLTGETN